MALVDLATFKFRGKIDYAGADADLQSILDDAESAVIDYLKRGPEDERPNDWTDLTVPGEVRQAIIRVGLIMLDQTTSGSNADFIDQGVRDLVHRHRDPALK